MASALWRVFYNIHLEDIGFTGTEIGTFNSIIQATIFFAVVLWGRYADKKGIRPTLRIGVIVTSVLVCFLAYLNEFWVLVFFLPILTFFYHPLGALNDAMAMQYATIEKKHSYGSFRLWGSLGWAIAAFVGGYIFTIIPLKYVFLASGLLFLVVISLLSTRKKVRTYKANFKLISIKEIIHNKPLLFFIVILVIYGVVCAPIFYYLNLYFSELNASNAIIGLAYAIMAISEVPLFLVGNKLLKKFGVKPLLFIAMASMVIRYFLFGYFPNIELALVIGLLQGVSFAFFLVAAVSIIEKLIPGGQFATAQSIIWGFYIGIGQTLGNFIIGLFMDASGMVGVMKLWVYVSFGCLLVALVYFKKSD